MRTPHGRKLASDLLAETIHRILEIRRIRGQNAKEIQTLQELLSDTRKRVEAEIAPHKKFLTEALPSLARWFILNLDRYGHGRQIDLPAGTLSARMSPGFKVEITGQKDDVIKRVAAMGPQYLTVTVTLNHDAIVADREKFVGFKGLEFTVRDTFEVKSDLVVLDEGEKQLARTPLRVWHNPRVKPQGRRARPKSP